MQVGSYHLLVEMHFDVRNAGGCPRLQVSGVNTKERGLPVSCAPIDRMFYLFSLAAPVRKVGGGTTNDRLQFGHQVSRGLGGCRTGDVKCVRPVSFLDSSPRRVWAAGFLAPFLAPWLPGCSAVWLFGRCLADDGRLPGLPGSPRPGCSTHLRVNHRQHRHAQPGSIRGCVWMYACTLSM